MSEVLWAVARFPNGSWSTGGSPDDPLYSENEVFQVMASTRKHATQKARSMRARKVAKAKRLGSSS